MSFKFPPNFKKKTSSETLIFIFRFQQKQRDLNNLD